MQHAKKKNVEFTEIWLAILQDIATKLTTFNAFIWHLMHLYDI